VGGSKLESLGKKGFEIRSFFSGLMSVRLSVRQANTPSSFWTQLAWANTNVGSVKGLLERAVSELQANTPRTLLRLGRLSKPVFA